MGDATHTPGPWRIDAEYPADIQSGDGRLEIACTSSSVLVDGEKPARSVQLANARLIAAAPELLEALQQLDAEWTKDIPTGPDGRVHEDGASPTGMATIHPDFIAIWKRVRAAIKKAKGEAS